VATAAQKILRARRHGIVNPLIAYQEARRAGLEFAVLCAVLEQETAGGHNVFGHDPTIFSGAGTVTEAKYKAYKKQRGPTGRGGMQGVGPMQLTWYSYQDKADAYGGSWKPRYNIRVGAEILRNYIRRQGLWHALQTYNGSAAYANEVSRKVNKWRKILS
jgi:soluble lytic murein transglycosylase-like protein